MSPPSDERQLEIADRSAAAPSAGRLVALWCGERRLVVETSYRASWSLPGGGIGRAESPRQAAVRELAEELDLAVAPERLVDPWTVTETSAWGRNTVTIFRLSLSEPPVIRIDRLEIVACHWLTRQEALASPLTSHVEDYLRGPGGQDRSIVAFHPSQGGGTRG